MFASPERTLQKIKTGRSEETQGEPETQSRFLLLSSQTNLEQKQDVSADRSRSPRQWPIRIVTCKHASSMSPSTRLLRLWGRNRSSQTRRASRLATKSNKETSHGTLLVRPSPCTGMIMLNSGDCHMWQKANPSRLTQRLSALSLKATKSGPRLGLPDSGRGSPCYPIPQRSGRQGNSAPNSSAQSLLTDEVVEPRS
jgi:hypothetical protein